MEADQFAGAYLSVVESIAKLVAAGFEHKRTYLSFQEYFERLRTEAERWGKPMAAVLGCPYGPGRPGCRRHRRQGLHERFV